MRNIALFAALFLSTPYGLAQAQISLAQVADSSPFRPLDLPTPNGTAVGRQPALPASGVTTMSLLWAQLWPVAFRLDLA